MPNQAGFGTAGVIIAAPRHTAGMPIILFRSRLRPGVADRFEPHAERMYELAQGMPGFVSSKDFLADDGERLALIEWDSHESLAVWRTHAEHAQAQAQGREDYFESYELQICDVVRTSRFDRQG